MNEYKNDGGPAFPRPRSADPEEYHKPETYYAQEGMTLRDYFAAKALQGLIAHLVGVEKAGPDGYAKRAYQYADAMIAERDK